MQNNNSINALKNIALIGAGISNLTLLHLLKRTPNLNMKVTLFERSKVIGGRVATRKRENYLYDNGANYFDFNDERIEDIITKDLPTENLFEINKPICLFNEMNEIYNNSNKPEKYERIFNYLNPVRRNAFTYNNGIKNLADLLLKSPINKENPNFSYELKFSKNIFSIQSRFNFDESSKLKYSWSLISEENENLGNFEKVIFGTPSLNIARVFGKSDFSILKKLNFHDKASGDRFINFDKKEQEIFENIKKDLTLCTYKKVYSMSLAYENLSGEPLFKNEFFGLVNVDNKHFISTVFLENEKNREHLKDNKQIFLVVQFKENELTKKLSFENDKNIIFNMVKDNLEKLLPDLKNKKILYHEIKSWGFAFPNYKINSKLLNALSERNIEIIGDSVSGVGKMEKAMLTAFETYQNLIKI